MADEMSTSVAPVDRTTLATSKLYAAIETDVWATDGSDPLGKNWSTKHRSFLGLKMEAGCPRHER